MLSMKLVSNSFRGVSALVSNQFGTSINQTVTTHQPKVSPNYCQPIQCRLISTSAPLTRALSLKAKKANEAQYEAEMNLPIRPKKPRTPWLTFVQERKDDVLSQKQKMTAPELAVILSKEWRSMDKTRYEEQYAREHEEYLRQIDNYENSLSDEHKLYLKQKKKETRESNAMKELSKTNMPTLPRNAANLFCLEKCKQPEVKALFETHKAAEVFSKLFKEYRELSESEKQKYKHMKEIDKARFHNEFLAWYEGIQNNDELGVSVREQARKIYGKYSSLGYI